MRDENEALPVLPVAPQGIRLVHTREAEVCDALVVKPDNRDQWRPGQRAPLQEPVAWRKLAAMSNYDNDIALPPSNETPDPYDVKCHWEGYRVVGEYFPPTDIMLDQSERGGWGDIFMLREKPRGKWREPTDEERAEVIDALEEML